MENKSNNLVLGCNKCQQNFILDQDDFSFYEKMKVPPPEVCPDCRFKMRSMWRNEMCLYSGRKCGLCEKNILSMYNPKSQYNVYCYDCFYSDKWDAKNYAQDYDYNKSFFEQTKDLLEKVPRINLGISSGDGPNVNSEYLNMASSCKNCFFVFNGGVNEETMYVRGVRHSFDSGDCYFGERIEKCYESINLQQSAGVLWGQNIMGCVDSTLIFNGSGLTNCFGCVNLRNKSNCWFNEQLSSEEYNRRILEIKGSYKKIEEEKEKFFKFLETLPHRANNNLKTIDSTGDYLTECKNVHNSFEIASGENCRYLFSSKFLKDSLGTIGYGTKSELLLEVVATGHSSNVIGSYWAENCDNIMYSFDIRNSNNCIGCNGLKNSKYCILNKQYTKEEYFEMVEKIKNHMNEMPYIDKVGQKYTYGEFFPSEISPFAYNESVAFEENPLTKDEMLALGYRWKEMESKSYVSTLKSTDLPNSIRDVSDSICNETIECPNLGKFETRCTKAFRILPDELSFYRQMNLPLPRYCPNCRYHNRLVWKNLFHFYKRECMCDLSSHGHDGKCSNKFETMYSTDRPEIIYCRDCYQKEIY